MALVVLALSCSSRGDDLTYTPPRESLQDAILNEHVRNARLCMRQYVVLLLNKGMRDSAAIVDSTSKACGGGVMAFMTQALSRPQDETQAFIQAMIYDELSRVPGVSRRLSPDHSK